MNNCLSLLFLDMNIVSYEYLEQYYYYNIAIFQEFLK